MPACYDPSILLYMVFDDENINLSDQEIHEQVNFILTNLQCSQEQCNNLKEATRNQAVSQLWYNHRKGRVTGTKVHDVLVRRQTTNGKSENQTKQVSNVPPEVTVSWTLCMYHHTALPERHIRRLVTAQ